MPSVVKEFAHSVTIICSWNGNGDTGRQRSVKWKWSATEYEVFHCGWLEETALPDEGSYLWDQTTMNRMSKCFALMLFHIPLACFPSVSLIFSQQKEKAYDQKRKDGKYGNGNFY